MKSLYLISFMLLVSLISSAQVKYIGHRGASYYAPENTLGSFQLAWQLGADGAECDIYLTTDNQIVVWQDGNTARMTVDGTKLEVAKSSYSELKKLEVKLNPTNSPFFAGQHIALLKDVFEVMKKDELLVIELKSGKEIIPTLKKVVDKYLKAGKIAFIGFSFEAISAAKATFPNTPCYWLSAKKEDVLKMIPELKKNNLDGVDLSSKIIDQPLLDELRKVNADVWCWTVDDVTEAKRMIDLGVNVITTNRPTWLKENMAATAK